MWNVWATFWLLSGVLSNDCNYFLINFWFTCLSSSKTSTTIWSHALRFKRWIWPWPLPSDRAIPGNLKTVDSEVSVSIRAGHDHFHLIDFMSPKSRQESHIPTEHESDLNPCSRHREYIVLCQVRRYRDDNLLNNETYLPKYFFIISALYWKVVMEDSERDESLLIFYSVVHMSSGQSQVKDHSYILLNFSGSLLENTIRVNVIQIFITNLY